MSLSEEDGMVNGKREAVAGPGLAPTDLNISGRAGHGVVRDDADGENAERVLERTLRRAELLGETAARLLATDEPQAIVEDLCRKVMEYLDCQIFLNFLAVPAPPPSADAPGPAVGRLRLNACAGITPEEAAKIEWLDYGAAICGCVARDGKRIVAEDIPSTCDPRTDLVRSYGVRAYACHPLLERDRAIGTLSFGSRSRDRFSADDLAMMKSVADLVAMALSRMRDAESLRQSEERLRRLNREMAERTAALQAVLDVAPVAVWIAHDAQCRRITGNQHADALIMRVRRGDNISASAQPDDAAVVYNVVRGGVELKPEELPAQLAAATGRPVEPGLLDLSFADGRTVHMFMGAVPVFDAEGRVCGAVAAGADVTPLKRAEESLRQSEERLRLVLQASSTGTFEVDLVTGEGRWNAVEFDLLGLKPDDATPGPETFFRFVHPEDVEPLRAQWEEALHAGTLDVEFRVVRADGQVRWLAGKGQFAFEGDGVSRPRGRATRFMGVNFDITARKQAEESLRQLNAQLEQRVAEQTSEIRRNNAYNRTLIEANPDPLMAIGPDGRITDVNAASERATGLSAKELIGTDFAVYFTEPAKARAGYRQAFKDGSVRDLPLELRHRDGHTVPVLYNAAVYRDEAGNVAGVFAAARDITDRKKAEDAARAERQRFYDVLETLPVYVILLSKDYRVPFANKFFRERFGESDGKRCHEYLFHRGEPCDNCETYKAMKTGAPHRWYWTGPDGRNYDIYDFPFTDADGSPMVMEMGIDITDVKRAEVALKEMNETLERRVTERTAELKATNEELARFNRAAVDRELRMIQLKKEVNDLCAKAGLPPAYGLEFEKRPEEAG